MPEEENQQEPKPIEITKSVTRQGEVVTFSRESITLPAPAKLKRWLAAIRYFLVTMITMVGGTDFFSGAQSKAIVFFMGVGILLTGAIEIGVGVKPLPDDK
jgi:hypothetical protein